MIAPETEDEVGEPGIFPHDGIHQRQRREELQLFHEHDRQRCRWPALAGPAGSVCSA